MKIPAARIGWALGATLIGGLTVPGSAFAQGCAMCYNTAAAARAGAIQSLRTGILVLLIPPVLIFGAVCLFAWRNRDRFNDDNAAEDNRQTFGRRLSRTLAGRERAFTKAQEHPLTATKEEWS